MRKYIVKIRNKIYSCILYIYYLIIELFEETILVQYSAHSTHLSLMNRNFGDDINKILIGLLSNKKVIPYKFSIIGKLFNKEKYMCIGSIISMFNLRNSIIWGTGILSSKFTINGHPKKIISVRGPLTRQCLIKNGFKCPEIYGDPALLLPLFYNPSIKKEYKIGIIPHYLDHKSPKLEKLINKLSQNSILISVTDYKNWKDFINKILSCDLILSSSLHGIIISDAYEVPNIWCDFGFKMDDDGFKFRDYFLSVKKKCDSPIENIESKKFEEIIELANKWEKPIFDKEKYLLTCPFRV